MNENDYNDIHSLSDNYNIIEKDFDTIIDEIDFESDEEKYLCESIIDNIEKQAAECIQEGKVVQLPFIGCVRYNPIKDKIKKNYDNFHAARKSMSKKQYKEHVAEYVNDIKKEQEVIDKTKLAYKRIKANNKKKYDKLCIEFGRSYADMYIYSIYLLSVVEFDAEWEEQYQSVKNG